MMYYTLLGCNGDVLNLYYAGFSGFRMHWNCNQDVFRMYSCCICWH